MKVNLPEKAYLINWCLGEYYISEYDIFEHFLTRGKLSNISITNGHCTRYNFPITDSDLFLDIEEAEQKLKELKGEKE